MSKVIFKFDTGLEVRCRVTGVKGIINARSEWLNGCIRYSVQPPAEKKTPTVMPDGWWIDEAQLEVISDGLNKKPIAKRRTGGPSTRSPRF